MGQKVKLTKREVDALQPPATGVKVVWDAELTGFGVRVWASGKRTYFCFARTKAGKQTNVTLGVHGQITVDQARNAAKRELGRIADGADPSEEQRQMRAVEEKRKLRPTAAQLCDRYLVEHAEPHKRSAAGDRAMIERLIKPRLGSILVAEVEQADVAGLHRELGRSAPYMANRVLALLSKMFSLAVLWRLRVDNPVKGIPRFQEERRERFLSTAEIRRLAQALGQYPGRTTANAIRMLLLTGARRGEVLAMRWDQMEGTSWVKPSAMTKQRRLHRVPLSPGALQLLEDMRPYRKGEYVFPGRSATEPHLTEIKKGWRSVCEAADLSAVRIHDLRHTFASVLASSGASLPLIGRLLGHTQASTTARYAHLFDEPLQEATNKVDALLQGLAQDQKINVRPLRRR